MTRHLALLAVLASAVGLSACVTVLPKQPPVQLYRFGAPPAVGEPTNAGKRVGLVIYAATLPSAARGDGILTIRGNEAAYVGGARWVVPAATLFQEAVIGGVEPYAPHVRLRRPGDAGSDPMRMRIDVRHFETVYAGAKNDTPQVWLEAVIQLVEPGGRAATERTVSLRIPASANRVGAIVAAYDEAVAQTVKAAASLAEAAASPPKTP